MDKKVVPHIVYFPSQYVGVYGCMYRRIDNTIPSNKIHMHDVPLCMLRLTLPN
jgi:hypothetical protein